ncbi:MAG: hypothetical protein JW818_00535 [Pirellulales bacterium]|nr:hypothetical protein [Pirellulales bacterium]
MEAEPTNPSAPPLQPGQFTLRRLIFVGVLCALLCSLWMVGGLVGLQTAILNGLILGTPLAVLGRRFRYILVCALAGSVIATIFGICDLGIDVEALNAPCDKERPAKVALFWWTVTGTLLGATLAMIRSWWTRRTVSSASPSENMS